MDAKMLFQAEIDKGMLKKIDELERSNIKLQEMCVEAKKAYDHAKLIVEDQKKEIEELKAKNDALCAALKHINDTEHSITVAMEVIKRQKQMLEAAGVDPKGDLLFEKK